MLRWAVPRVIAIVPARFASTRFPGKPLVPLRNKTLLEWVWSGAKTATKVQKVLIATDDARIHEAAVAFGAETVMTPADCVSGTDRVALVAAEQDAEIVINVQGDEPLVSGSSLDRLVGAFEDPTVEAATLREPFDSAGDLFDPNQVKVVVTPAGDALYFSRSPIPYTRGKGHLTFDFRGALFARPNPLEGYWKHVGIYAYRRSVLLHFARTTPTPLELAEGLEQLRLLETGRKIRVFDSDFRSVGVDTPQDLRLAAQLLDERETKR